MTQTFTKFLRFSINGVLFILWSLLLVGSFLALHFFEEKLSHSVFITGWLLLLMMLFLTLYNARKKIPFFPLLKSKAWLHGHIYIGMLCIIVFLLHTRFSLPHGLFEWGLYLLFAVVSLSGIYGWILSRKIPKVMTSLGGEVLYETIPQVRKSFSKEAEELALSCIELGKERFLADVYDTKLDTFFQRSSLRWSDLFFVQRSTGRRLITKISEIKRYLSSEEVEKADRLIELIYQKDALDRQQFFQRSLRYWLFAHIPFTFSLLVFSAFHLVIVLAFMGGE